MADRLLVEKITDEVDPRDVYATTYQMRNFFLQLGGGFFSSLDVMNFVQHHYATMLMRTGDVVLDVCCGRGLLLPLIRWYRPKISEYIGVDISERNIREQLRRSASRPIDDAHAYYPFKLTHQIISCEDMHEVIQPESVDLVIYTSAIEHMQKEVGQRSLANCFSLLRPGGQLYISCPNTFEKKDPYETQYAAHIYEWDLAELTTELQTVGFCIDDTFGLLAKKRDFEKFMHLQPQDVQDRYARLARYFPNQWLMSIAALDFPQVAAEVGILCHKKKRQGGFFDH